MRASSYAALVHDGKETQRLKFDDLAELVEFLEAVEGLCWIEILDKSRVSLEKNVIFNKHLFPGVTYKLTGNMNHDQRIPNATFKFY